MLILAFSLPSWSYTAASCTWGPELCKDLTFPGAAKHQLLTASLWWLLTHVSGQSLGSTSLCLLNTSETSYHVKAACVNTGRIGDAEDRLPNELKSPNLCYPPHVILSLLFESSRTESPILVL